jgi:hypothetical protein
MVNIQTSDLVSLADFPLAWRFTDERWTRLPDQVLEGIKPLSATRFREIVARSPFEVLLTCRPDFSGFDISKPISLEEKNDATKSWFLNLPIASNSQVYLCWSTHEGLAAVTSWRTFVDYWDDFWYPFDFLFIFDETRNWAVCLGSEEIAVFLQPRTSTHRLQKSNSNCANGE